MVVIATVVAVMVSRSLHATTLPHRLSALVYVPLIGILASFVGRFMLHHTWFGAAAFVASVGGSRYLMRFGGKVRRFGRLALTPLIAVLVTPVPPSAAKATGPLWGAVAGFIAVACVIAAQAASCRPGRPARRRPPPSDFVRVARRLRALTPGTRPHTRAARALHRAALTVETRLAAARLPEDADHSPLDALAAAVLAAEVRAQTAPAADRPAPGDEPLPERTAPDRAASPGGEPSRRRARPPTRRRPPSEQWSPSGQRPRYRRPSPAPPPPPSPPHIPRSAARPPPLDNSSGGSPDRLDTALDAALAVVTARAAAVRALASGEHPHPDVPAPRRRTGGWRDLQPQTRLTAQLAAAMAAAFAVGHLFFPHRWAWTVITAFVVCSAARGRGDVVHRSGLRVLGAFIGAVTGTLVAHLVAGEPPVAVIRHLLLPADRRLAARTHLRDLGVLRHQPARRPLLAQRRTRLRAARPAPRGHPPRLGLRHRGGLLRPAAAHRDRHARPRRGRPAGTPGAAGRPARPRPAARRHRHLARRFDRAAEELAVVAAPARVHRTLLHRRLNRRRDAASPHAADWADSLAACAHAARALAATDAAALAAARAQLGLDRPQPRPGAPPPRPRPGRRTPRPPPAPAPPTLIRLDALLAELYDRLPAPAAAPPVPVPAVAAG